MANKGVMLLGGLAAAGGLLFFLASKSQASSLEPAVIPTVDDILQAESLAELDVWYNLIGELYITDKITYEQYTALYNAYYERWYQLTGG